MQVSMDCNRSKPNFGIKNFKPRNILSQDELKLLNEFKKQYNYADTKSLQWKTKRILDVGLSIIGAVLSAPIMLLSALAVKLTSKGPLLFKQERIGKDGDTFIIYKLRTMKKNADPHTNVQDADDERVTKVGKFLRKYSLDELPQFYNIIKGDMSLSGPRAIPVKDHAIRKQNDAFVMRYVFKPGASLDCGETAMQHFVDNNPEASNIAEQEYVKNWNLKKD